MQLFDDEGLFKDPEEGGEEELGLGEDLTPLMPDRIPDWLMKYVRDEKLSGDHAKLLQKFYSETHTVKSDRFDKKQYKNILDSVSELKDIANSKWNDNPTWFELVEDEFHSFYKANPELRKKNQMKPTHKINHAAMDKAKQTKQWEELRSYTQLDQWAAAAAAISFSEHLSNLFDEAKELQEAQDGINIADAELGDAIGNMDIAEDPDDFLEALKEALDKYGQADKDIDKAIHNNSNKMRNAVKQAMQEAADAESGVEGLMSAFGTEPGELKRMDAEERMALASRIRKNKKLREMAEKIGRHVRLAMGEQARKLNHAPDELHSIEQGNNINRVIPAELMYLTDTDLEDVFYKKFVSRQLLQYKLRGYDKVGRGAIICLLDSSGSMYGAKETWAKAVAIAMLNIAKRQGRDFYGILFSYGKDIMEFHFPKGVAKISDVLDFAEFSYHGGTDFETPLSRAVEILSEQYQSEELKRGDILMVTDGEAPISDEWLKEYKKNKEDMAFRTYSCLIGTEANSLRRISDEVTNIVDLVGGEDVRDLYRI